MALVVGFILASLLATSYSQQTLLVLTKYLTVSVPMRRADAIILLAGDDRVRTPVAASLFRSGYAPRVIVSNDGILSSWSPNDEKNLYQIDWTCRRLEYLGVPASAIVKLPFHGSGTIYDAMALRDYASLPTGAKILIVTSAYHTRRALWTFRRLFGDSVAVGIYPIEASGGSEQSHAVLTEYVKIIYYHLRYGFLAVCLGTIKT